MREISFADFGSAILALDEQMMSRMGKRSIFFWILDRIPGATGTSSTAKLDAWEVFDLAILAELYFGERGRKILLTDGGKLAGIRTVGDLFLLAAEHAGVQASFE